MGCAGIEVNVVLMLFNLLPILPLDGGGMVAAQFLCFQAEDGIRDHCVTGVQTCALPISSSVSSLWADEGVYYPVDVEPYTPAVYEASGKQDPAFRTKLVLARQLVERAIGEGLPFRGMVADSFYGEDRTLRQELRTLGVPYVMALKPSHAWWHPEDVAGTLQDVAHEAGWVSAEQPGPWVHMTRTFRDGSSQDWWVVEIVAGPYGPDKTERAIVATTDPQSLPDLSTWYLVTNLPAPTERLGSEPPFPPASLEEVIRLYGLRMWV